MTLSLLLTEETPGRVALAAMVARAAVQGLHPPVTLAAQVAQMVLMALGQAATVVVQVRATRPVSSTKYPALYMLVAVAAVATMPTMPVVQAAKAVAALVVVRVLVITALLVKTILVAVAEVRYPVLDQTLAARAAPAS